MSYTFKDSTGATRYASATGAGTSGDPDVPIVGSGATDDAAAAGQIFPMAGVYQSTVDEVDAKDVGRVRMSVRRAQMVAPDSRIVFCNSSTVANAGDILVSTTGTTSGFAAPTTAFFNGADAAWGVGALSRWIAIPMVDWRDLEINIYHDIGVNLTISLYNRLSLSTGEIVVKLASISTITSGSSTGFGSNAGGTGAANYNQVAAILNPASYIIVELTAASDPSTGGVAFMAMRRAQ